MVHDYRRGRGILRNRRLGSKAGAIELAEAVSRRRTGPRPLSALYPEWPPRKDRRIARVMWRGRWRSILPAARRSSRAYRRREYSICMAKTQTRCRTTQTRGRPRGFTLTVRDAETPAGRSCRPTAIVRMPHSERPAAGANDVDDEAIGGS